MPVVVRKLNKRGRIAIPKEWRDKHAKVGKFVMMLDKGEIRMIPVGTADLTEYFDSIEMDLERPFGLALCQKGTKMFDEDFDRLGNLKLMTE
jgi:bifunctional DNA-binding transcriptional regulator/antitoxin component of YhaV-PrlF toxin-antitoxin module